MELYRNVTFGSFVPKNVLLAAGCIQLSLEKESTGTYIYVVTRCQRLRGEWGGHDNMKNQVPGIY